MSYKILHDTGKPTCFIGDSYAIKSIIKIMSHLEIEQVSLEEALTKDKNWWDARQFFHASTQVAFRKSLVEKCQEFNPCWISFVSDTNVIDSKVTIGKNVLVNQFNHLYGPAIIEDHSIITSFCQISHLVLIKEFNYISPYSYLCFTELGKGNCLATRSVFLGKSMDSPLVTADWCNFIVNSTVTKSVRQTGTYFGNRMIDNKCSLESKIL
ncbi:MAG TPA: hypothetical protein DCE78_04285 [Bacteroidetes bacterium]|nr:hypothetical protein [Bacteroidota bacterium]